MKKDELINEIIHLQREVNRILRQREADAWINLTLTIAQVRSLFLIDREGSTNFRNLAAALGVTPANMTGVVDRLVEQGLVSRQENPEDRRMTLLRVTDKGSALIADLRGRRISHMSELLSRFSLPELEAIAEGFRLLAKTAETMEGKDAS
jgi:DNA-binding MarR family transcriptional regulator